MKTISQIAQLSGISVRTLQYYDEIGLLTPSEFTQSGYRLYDDKALEKLQQILFFKELGFTLKDIHEILQNPDFDRIAAFKKQKELLLLKRNRTDRLIQLLNRLEKGEQCMSFKEFDLSAYIEALENFKESSLDNIVKHWGNVENFDLFVQKVKENESEVAKLAIKQFGSIENYTEAMKYNLQHFEEIMKDKLEQIPETTTQNDLFYKLASCKEKEVASPEIQQIVREIIAFAHGNTPSELFENHNDYCHTIIDTYSNNYISKVIDAKYGAGACDYIVKAFEWYLRENLPF